MLSVLSIPALYRGSRYYETSSGSIDSSVELAQTGIPVLPSTICSPNFHLEIYSTDFDQTKVELICGMLDSLFHDECAGARITLANQIQEHCELLEPPYTKWKMMNITINRQILLIDIAAPR